MKTWTEGQVFFIYDVSYCQHEEDDPKDAIVYFYPANLANSECCDLCLQLMGVARFMWSVFSKATLIKLSNGKFALKMVGNYILALKGSSSMPDKILQHQLDNIYDIFVFYQKSIDNVYERANHDRKKFLQILKLVFDASLSVSQCGGDTLALAFNIVATANNYYKNDGGLFFRALHLLQSCQKQYGVFAGSVMHNNKIVHSQLPTSLIPKVAAVKPNQSKMPGMPVDTGYSSPMGVSLLQAHVTNEEFSKLSHIRNRNMLPSYPSRYRTCTKSSESGNNPSVGVGGGVLLNKIEERGKEPNRFRNTHIRVIVDESSANENAGAAAATLPELESGYASIQPDLNFLTIGSHGPKGTASVSDVASYDSGFVLSPNAVTTDEARSENSFNFLHRQVEHLLPGDLFASDLLYYLRKNKRRTSFGARGDGGDVLGYGPVQRSFSDSDIQISNNNPRKNIVPYTMCKLLQGSDSLSETNLEKWSSLLDLRRNGGSDCDWDHLVVDGGELITPSSSYSSVVLAPSVDDEVKLTGFCTKARKYTTSESEASSAAVSEAIFSNDDWANEDSGEASGFVTEENCATSSSSAGGWNDSNSDGDSERTGSSKNRNGLHNRPLCLYVQQYSSSTLLLLMDLEAAMNYNIIMNLWKLGLNCIVDLELDISDIIETTLCEKMTIPRQYLYLQYDDATKWLTGDVPETDSQNFPEMLFSTNAQLAHEEFVERKNLKDIIMWSVDHVIYGHRSGTKETFYQTDLSATLQDTKENFPLGNELFATIHNKAKSSLERNHQIIIH